MAWLKHWWQEIRECFAKPSISEEKAKEIADGVRAEHGQKAMTFYFVWRDGDYWVVNIIARSPDTFRIHRNTGEVKEYNLIQIGADHDCIVSIHHPLGNVTTGMYQGMDRFRALMNALNRMIIVK